MNGLREKCEKPPFFGILGQEGQFWTVLGQNGRNGIFFKKALGTFLSRLQALTNCKVSEKSNEGIPRKRVAHGQTDKRTNGRTDRLTNEGYITRLNNKKQACVAVVRRTTQISKGQDMRD